MQDTQVKDAVDQVRSATQQLHRAISDAAAEGVVLRRVDR